MTKKSKSTKRKVQFLNRRERFMTRYNDREMRQFKTLAKNAGLSRQEFSRRRVLGLPVVELAPAKQETQSEAQTA